MEQNKIDVVVRYGCPLVLTAESPNCFGTMEIEKGAYVEINANMDISIDVLKRPDEKTLADSSVEKMEGVLENPEFDFYVKGKDGEKGKDGTNGADGDGPGNHGIPGYPGSVGKRGDDGPNLTITVYDLQENFSLLNTGGTGGRGGKGGDGGNGANNSEGTGGNGGNAGDGGNGGNGGDGGDITVYYPTTSKYNIKCKSTAAYGGEGGMPGHPGAAGAGVSPGSVGETAVQGSNGMKGSIGKVTVNPSSLNALLRRPGGTEWLKNKYPAVYEGLMMAQQDNKSDDRDETMNDVFELDSPGLRMEPNPNCGDADSASLENCYMVSDALGKFPRGMEYVFMHGELMEKVGDNVTIVSSFADEFTADDNSLVSDTQSRMKAFFPDVYRLDDATYHSEGECYAVDTDGKVHSFKGGRSQDIVVEGGDSIVTELKVTNPIYTNSEKSDNIIVLYAREPRDNEETTWDYKYPDNHQTNNKVKTMLSFSGSVKVKDNYKILGYSNMGCEIALYYSGLSEPTALYHFGSSSISQYFKVSDDQKTCDFNFDDDWGCDMDVSAYSVSCIQMLKTYFYLSILTPAGTESGVGIVVNSTNRKDETFFIAKGTTAYVPPISIRWGCFHKQTRIKMADGSEKCICDIAVNDTILSGDGQPQRVVQVYTGHEEELVCLETEDEKQLLVTAGHPVRTADGIVCARDIRAGNELVTYDGSKSKVRFVYPYAYNDTVYNLELESSKELISEGILTGDFIMQNSIPTAKREKPCTEKAAETVRQLKLLLRELGAIKE